MFLVDDVWPSAARCEGYLPDIQGILSGSPNSRIAISTRSRDIAAKIGSYVDFGARDPQRPVSLTIFMSHAVPSTRTGDQECGHVRDIIDLCAGLPIALAVAGTGVAYNISRGLGFQCSCRTYLEEVSKELHSGASFLGAVIEHSLRTLEEQLEKNGNNTRVQ